MQSNAFTRLAISNALPDREIRNAAEVITFAQMNKRNDFISVTEKPKTRHGTGRFIIDIEDG